MGELSLPECPEPEQGQVFRIIMINLHVNDPIHSALINSIEEHIMGQLPSLDA
jgi:hypothetical protein